MDESPLAALLAGGSQTSDVAVNQAARRKLAETMANAGLDTSPVGHWTQALARVLQAGGGALLNRQLDTEEANRRTALANLLAGGGQASASVAAPAAAQPDNQQPTVAPDQSPQSSPRSALLAAISGGEAPDYNVKYGGGRFASYADHPREAVPITSGPYAGQTSSAAGKYQFLAPTWDAEAKKLGLKDFSPASQDAAAWDLASTTYKAKTGRDLEGDLKAGRTEDVSRALKGVWPSLPGGDQPNRATGSFGSRLASALAGGQEPMAFSGEPQPSALPVTPAALAPPQQVAAASQAAQPALPPQAQQAQQILSQIPPEVRTQAKQLVLAGMESEAVKLLQPYYKPPEYGFQTLADGTIVKTDPRTGTVTPVYEAPVKPQWGVVAEDQFGNKQYGFIEPVKKQITPASGVGTGLQTASATGGEGLGGLLAPGVKQVNNDLTGDEYLKQWSPEMQSAVKAYVDGRSMPTGNPRKGFTQAVKMVAQKYGDDIGLPADDTTFSARRTMRTQLSSAGPSSLGGQINVGNTAIGHLADLSQKAIDLGNYDVLGIAPLSHAVNLVRGQTTEQSAKLEALKAAAQHYGQEVTKFYSGSPGGIAERDRFMDAISGAKTPQELAGVIATEAELMHSRLGSLESQIEGTLGKRGLEQYPVVRPSSQKALETISANVSKLKGGGGKQETNKEPVKVSSPDEARKLPKGRKIILPDGSPGVVP